MHFSSNKIKRIKALIPHLALTVLCFFIAAISFSQERKMIEILNADSLVQSESIANVQRLLNSVIIKHNEVLMYCDSAYSYQNTNRVDAFGNVHINQGDTLHLYASKVFYDGDISFAQAIRNVRLENKGSTLFTDTLDYDMEKNIGYYDCKGRIVDSTNVLSSQVGKYYLDEDLIHFIDSVKGYNGSYTLTSDDIRYNTVTEVIYIDGPTVIQDSLNTLVAEDGWYNTITGEAELTLRPQVFNATQYLEANYISYNKEKGDGKAIGTVHMEDYENRTIVKGNNVTFNKLTEISTATDSAVFISYNDTDSLYLHADTLTTAPDTVEGANIVRAYYNVRFFRTDVQGVCDSLIYFSRDSVVELHNNPVIWSEMHQLSANNISLVQKANAPDELHMSENSFIISRQDSGRYDQIKGKEMLGFVINGELNNVFVDGNGQTLYYARDENVIIGINRAESSTINIKFVEGRINSIKFNSAPTGELLPLDNLTDSDKTLPGFVWKNKLRPLSKDDIFRKVQNITSESDESSQMKSATEVN